MDSILLTIKKLIGITEEQTNFDADIIIHINTVFSFLKQLGVGPINGFFIEDDTSTWNEYISNNSELLGLVQPYVYFKVRLAFDPPQSSTVIESINRQISELEWRILASIEPSINKGGELNV